MKTCSKCKIGQPPINYHKDKHARGGLKNQCKDCCNKNYKKYTSNPENYKKMVDRKNKWNKENREQVNIKALKRYHKNKKKRGRSSVSIISNKLYVIPTSKICKSCELDLPMNSFIPSGVTKDGREGKCRECRKAQRKIAVRKNQELIISGEINLTEKKCKACQKFKLIEHFSKDSSRGDGLDTKCKKCSQEYRNNYRTSEGGKSTRKIWMNENREIINKINKKSYHRNSAKRIKKNIEYGKTDSGRWTKLKLQAKQRGKEVTLTKEEFLDITSRPCTYCNSDNLPSGIDRANSNAGYTLENSTSCCSYCNYMKNNLTISGFIEHINKILKFQEFGIYEDRIPFIKLSGNRESDRYNTSPSRFSAYRANARNRKKEFKIDYNDFAQFWQKNCEYCGSTIDTVGIDRIDNSIGYEMSNLVPCCKNCNSMKWSKSTDELINQCNIIINNYNYIN